MLNTKNTVPIKSTIKNLDVIIPAAGMGQRMKSYGPKAFIKIHNEHLIERQIRLLNKELKCHTNIIVVTGYESQKLEKLKLPVSYVHNDSYAEENVVSSIEKALPLCKYEHLLILHGDLVFNMNSIKLPLSDKSLMMVDNYGTMDDREVGTIINGHYIEQIFYGLENKWGQIVYLTGKELEVFKELVISGLHRKKYTFEIINQTIEHGGKFLAYSPKNAWIIDLDISKDIGTAEELCK